MKITVTQSDFRQAFKNMGRGSSFSYDGLNTLFDYLEGMEQGTGEEMELDVIAICCDFTEYESLEELQDDYSDIESIEDLRDRTLVIEFEGGIIVQAF